MHDDCYGTVIQCRRERHQSDVETGVGIGTQLAILLLFCKLNFLPINPNRSFPADKTGKTGSLVTGSGLLVKCLIFSINGSEM